MPPPFPPMPPGPGHFGPPPPPPPPSKAAFFHLRRGDAEISIKCAETEPMKACVDAASALLDKVAASPAGTR